MNKSIVAGIVTYNPAIERLEGSIKSIIEQVNAVCIVDNSSDNIDKIENLQREYKFTLIKNTDNKGIAFALNQIMNYAKEQGAAWCVTLDQDSISPSNLVEEAEKLFECQDIGQIVPMIFEERAKEYCYLGTPDNGKAVQKVEKSITSASINRVEAWSTCGKFDEMLFIDYVDYDFCMKLKMSHYKIYRLNTVILKHQIGDSFNVNILGYKIRVGNHSSFRKYYIGRNIIIYIHRYKNELNCVKEYMRLIKVFLLIVLFENDKKIKCKAFLRGVHDGKIYIARCKKI